MGIVGSNNHEENNFLISDGKPFAKGAGGVKGRNLIFDISINGGDLRGTYRSQNAEETQPGTGIRG